MPRELMSVETIKEAMKQAHGLVNQTANILGVSRQTVNKYFKRYPELIEYKTELVNDLGDVAENILYEKAILERDTTSLIFLLKTKFRDRGYWQGVQHNVVSRTENEITVRIIEEDRLGDGESGSRSKSLPEPSDDYIELPDNSYTINNDYVYIDADGDELDGE